MILLEEIRSELVNAEPEVKELGEVLQIERAKQELEDLHIQVTYEGFWDNPETSQKVMQKIRTLENKVERFEKLQALMEDTIGMIDLVLEEGDDSSNEEIAADAARFREELEAEKLKTLLCGEYDSCNAILTLHAGAGGTEAQDWAQMLYRMYNKYAESHGFKVDLLDWLDGDSAGIKSASFMVEGENAYGFLKSEAGVHRLVRISPFDASGRRQTSFAALEVMPEIDDDVEVEIRPEDIKIVPVIAGQFSGVVETVTFKGVHYEMIVDVFGTKWKIHSTQSEQVGSMIGMLLNPEDLAKITNATYADITI